MAIKVDLAKISSISSNLNSSYEELQKVIADCDTAASDAITAAGGSTPVANAISSALSSGANAQLTKFGGIINELTKAVSQVSATYKTEHEELLTKIQNIANQFSSSGTTGTGTGM